MSEGICETCLRPLGPVVATLEYFDEGAEQNWRDRAERAEADVARLTALLAEYERMAEYIKPILCEQAALFPTLAKKHLGEQP